VLQDLSAWRASGIDRVELFYRYQVRLILAQV